MAAASADHQSITQSISVICSHQMPDFSTKMHQIQFLAAYNSAKSIKIDQYFPEL